MNKFGIFCTMTAFVFVQVVSGKTDELAQKKEHQISKPLVTHIYVADPSAHVFGDKVYIYPSHDVTNGIYDDSPGGGFGMVDYHVFSMNKVRGKVTDYGEVLHVKDVSWATKMMWAPDAAYRNGKYYLYFPAKDKEGLFRIGVAIGETPTGPFVPQLQPIKGSYSIDPCVFTDDDASYLYFGGIDGGQLQNFNDNKYGEYHSTEPEAPSLCPRIAKLTNDMLEFSEEPKGVQILDQNGEPLKDKDHDKRFFEAAWVHKYKGIYYFSYSTGDTHQICYATGDRPYGPFTYQGVILKPVVGWTTHHSICEFKGKWYLFYHDCLLSGGNTTLRSIKMTELKYDKQGKIIPIDPYSNGSPHQIQKK